MVQLLEVQESLDLIALAASLSKEFAQTAVERDAKAGIPEYEIERLRESGLLPLVVPKEYGGIGATWAEALKIVQELSKADGSIGQLYGNHLNLTAVGHFSGTPEQKQRYYRETARNNWFWANAVNTRDTRLKITPEGDNFRVNGIKSFGTGVAAADVRVFSALQDGVEEPVLFVIPSYREGVISNHDWDNVGQRRTDSGSFTFHNVLVKKDEILGPPTPPDSTFATFLGIIAQLTKTHIYLGIVQGAFEAAREYTTTITKPWITSGVESATQDPYILRYYGELWVELKAAIGLVEEAAEIVQVAWEKEVKLTPEERGEAAIAVFSAKVFVTKVGLDITNRIFEVMGTRATATKYGFDRYWRDLRTFLLRALDKFGLSEKDIELVQLQHADGRAALEKGDVDAWAGLDPQMAKTEIEKGSRLFFREPNFNSYGVLNVREEFANRYPDDVERVLANYEKARQWALQHPNELKQVLVKASKLTDAVAAKQLERTDLSNARIGDAQKEVISAAGDVLKKSGVIQPSVNVAETVNNLINPQFITKVASK